MAKVTPEGSLNRQMRSREQVAVPGDFTRWNPSFSSNGTSQPKTRIAKPVLGEIIGGYGAIIWPYGPYPQAES